MERLKNGGRREKNPGRNPTSPPRHLPLERRKVDVGENPPPPISSLPTPSPVLHSQEPSMRTCGDRLVVVLSARRSTRAAADAGGWARSRCGCGARANGARGPELRGGCARDQLAEQAKEVAHSARDDTGAAVVAEDGESLARA